jgi:predicted dehydrogenase
MSDPNVDLDLHVMPNPPAKRDYRIGVIGAGFIVADVQIPAYIGAGFTVAAIASRTPANAQAVADRHGIPTCYATWMELLDDESIEVLDIAFPPDQQLEIIEEACARPHIKGILAQKPLAADYAEAQRAVEVCKAAGKILSVNQNMRYDQSMRGLKTLLDRGDLGTPVLATIEMRAVPHWQPFLEGSGRLTLGNMSIHHIDAFRFLFGDPEGIFVSARTDPRTTFEHTDGICLYVLEYADGMRASGWDDVWTGPVREGCEGDIYIKWRVEGTDGLAWGTIGWPYYPTPTPSTVKFATKRAPGEIFEPSWDEVWFPDAFAGTMGALFDALNGGPNVLSGEDNLTTMALIEAGYRSIGEKRVVRIDEIAGSQPAGNRN